jgi:hypothetical protein
MTTAGRPALFPIPKAKNPADRSSRTGNMRNRTSPAAARTRGVEREPGATQISRTPARASSSRKARAHRVLAVRTSLIPLSRGLVMPGAWARA